MERGIIDRFEGDIAVVEVDGSTRDYVRSKLPRGAQAGDAIVIENGEIRLDEAAKEKRKRDIDRLMDELFE
ncbi:DUF3006 domain-containing protein [Cohnella boryungensis]|uniref:DUF3006 domain-containing protein n=1 Tax=Cohnella boryungensis TaxID=768479 RepID=A0ABV8SFP7_9BACL